MQVNLNINNYLSNKLSFGHVNDRDKYLARNFSIVHDDSYRDGTHYSNTDIEKMRPDKRYKLSKATQKHGEYEYYRSCKRKKRFPSYPVAKRVANKMHKIHTNKNFDVYNCKFCDGWHVYTVKTQQNSGRSGLSGFQALA